MWDALGITGAEALTVVLSAVGIYVAFLILVRTFGQRAVARMSTSDIAVVLTLGSVAGRVITGYTPTLAAGVIALVTLFALRWLAQTVGRSRIGSRIVRDRPVLLMAAGRLVHDHLRRARVAEEEVWEALRVAGVRTPDEVAWVVLESTGAVSVTKRGGPLDARLLAGVRGADLVPPDLFAREP